MLSTTLSISDEHITPGPQIRDFIKPIRKMLIAGKWVDSASGKTFPVYNPASGEEITRVAEGDREDIDRAV